MTMETPTTDTGYAYALGLVSGLQGKMLAKRDMEALIASGGPAEALAILETTPYRETLGRLGGAYAPPELEGAISRHLEKSYAEVSAAVPESERRMLDSLILGGWDTDNIRTVLRAYKAGKAGEGILSMLFPHGLLGREQLKGILTLNGAEEIPPRLPQPYQQVVKAAIQSEGAGQAAEEALDRGFHRQLLEEVGGGVRGYVLLSTDTLNIRTIIRCRLNGIEPSPHIIGEGYHLGGNRLAQLGRQDLAGILKTLEDTPWGQPARESAKDGAVDLNALEAGLRAELTRETEYNALLRPLSVYTVIAHIRRKEAEALRLRAIMAGKYRGLKPEELKGLAS
jgi:vacuolar-type H+-ATPase subunit C/Vma6